MLHSRTDKRLDALGAELRRLAERVGLLEGARLSRPNESAAGTAEAPTALAGAFLQAPGAKEASGAPKARHGMARCGVRLRSMSAELIGILAVGAALAGMILTAALWMGGWLRALDGRVGTVEQRIARLEGLIEGSGLFRPLETAGHGD